MQFKTKSLFVLLAVVAIALFGLLEWRKSRPLDWEVYDPNRVREQLDAGRVVVVSISARWDVSTVGVEYHQLQKPRLIRFVRDQRVAPFIADVTTGAGAGKDMMRRLGLVTVPAVVVYSPLQPSDPVVLTDRIPESQLRQTIAHAKFPIPKGE